MLLQTPQPRRFQIARSQGGWILKPIMSTCTLARKLRESVRLGPEMKSRQSDTQTVGPEKPTIRHSDSQTRKADNQTVRLSDPAGRQSDTQTVRPGRQAVRQSDSHTRHADSQTVRQSDLAGRQSDCLTVCLARSECLTL